MSGVDRLSDEAWAVLEPHLPKNRPGAPRVDDRRVISGILHVLRSGCRWKDCPPEYGPSTTIYNRYNRWSAQGLWHKLFGRLAAAGSIPDELSIDSTHIKAHRSAAGSKKGCGAGDRPLTWRMDQQDPRSGQRSRQADRLRPDARHRCRHQRRGHVARRCRAAEAPVGGQGLRRRSPPKTT